MFFIFVSFLSIENERKLYNYLYCQRLWIYVSNVRSSWGKRFFFLIKCKMSRLFMCFSPVSMNWRKGKKV